ncbi:hypothetical protein MBLNU230_g4808t1 [Neophaeotheca triangularis]
MQSSQPVVNLPESASTVDVKVINPVNFGPARLHRFMAPSVDHLEIFPTSPSLCFLLEHNSGRKLVWDLGIRKDHENYAPSIASYLPTTGYDIQIQKNVADILEDGDVNLNDIEAVIWSHWHWDHIGDPSSFPKTTSLIVGPGFKEAMLPGAPVNPKSPILAADYEGRELREIDFDNTQSLQIGRFKAFDYFGDGSFYLLDSPGHAVGHLCGLARTTSDPSTFVLLGGDICHYAGIFRPSEHLPMPPSISPHPFNPSNQQGFCPGHWWEELQKSRGRKTDDSLYDMTFGGDIPLANATKGKLQELDCRDDVFVIIAHDSTVRDGVPHFPESINDWQKKGWGKDLKWRFVRDLEVNWNSSQAV